MQKEKVFKMNMKSYSPKGFEDPEVHLGENFLVRQGGRGKIEDTFLGTEGTGYDILKMFQDARTEFSGGIEGGRPGRNNEGSTLTIAELDKEGNLRFGILGDSPVYLIVKDEKGYEKVIKLSEDMAMIPGTWVDGNLLHHNTTRYSQYGTGLKQSLQVAGAIGDKMHKGMILSVPEYYDFSRGAEYTKKLNDFLKNIEVQGDINDLLQNGEAKVVVGSDGLDSEKIGWYEKDKSTNENTLVRQSVHDYELCFANQKDFLPFDIKLCELDTLKLPPGNISFKECEEKK